MSPTFSKQNIFFSLLIVILVAGICIFITKNNYSNSKPAVNSNNTSAKRIKIKIGVITDLSGPASGYWGNSTASGAKLAQRELQSQGFDAEFITEDYALDAPKSLNAVKKLVEIDQVDAIYAEFNPAAYTVAPYLKDKNKLLMMDAAATSPLDQSPNNFKTYLDYQEGCKQIAQKFKTDGVAKIGSLKVNLEFGELCDKGIREVFQDQVDTQDYNLGDTDFKTQLLKISSNGATAVINTGFEADTINTLKVIKESSLNIKYGTVGDTLTPNVTNQYQNELKGGYSFNFKAFSPEFKAKLKAFDPSASNELSAGLVYTHSLQMVKALDKCQKEIVCARKAVQNSSLDTNIGFLGFGTDRIAKLEMEITRN